MKRLLLITIAFLFLQEFTNAQITLPPSGNNQKCKVYQYIGPLAYVGVKYNSPDVTGPNGQDRKGQIWGQLVPWGMAPNSFGSAKEIPWRAGANENTVIKFSHDMTVQGQNIPAGKYGLHMIPRENEAWTVIFSKDTEAWGSYFYDEANDALRVEATPRECEYTEWLTFVFTDRQADKATLSLKWENLELPMEIGLPNGDELVAKNLESELTSSKGFTWTNWNNAANYMLQSEYDLEKGLEWADAAISAPFIGNENFGTLSTKAQLLAKMGKMDESAGIMDKAVNHPTATVFQIHGYGRQLIAGGKADEAMKVFEMNVERFGDAWPTHVGMARGHSALGNYDKALEHAKIAHGQAPDKLNKDNLASAIEKLKNKQDIN